MNPVDMGRFAVVMRCFADFVAARPGLPEIVGADVRYSRVTQQWSVRGQLLDISGTAGVERWALAIDDPVITSREHDHEYGAYLACEVTGTVHGHPVSVWTHIPRGGRR